MKNKRSFSDIEYGGKKKTTRKEKRPGAPLFRDPIHDGAADPVVIWNRNENAWWILYTNRRADAIGMGTAWAHGTDIGIASSSDGGLTWLYRGTLQGLEFEPGRNTFWAPEVLWHEGVYHLYISYVRGVPSSWVGERHIIHYTSRDLWRAKFQSVLNLSSRRVIDACVYPFSGCWRMLYKDEDNDSMIYASESADLYQWNTVGPIIEDEAQEGPYCFVWKNRYWLIADAWKGLNVYQSVDGISWTRQGRILDKPGNRLDDGSFAHHASVHIKNDRAFIFYFTHPGENKVGANIYKCRRSSIQVAELELNNGVLECDRDKEFDMNL